MWYLRFRVVYMLLLASSLLYLGSGDVRAFLLILMTLLAYASMVERVLHVFEFVSVLLHLGAVALGVYIVYTFRDPTAVIYSGMCVLAPLALYILIKLEEAGLIEIKGGDIIIKLSRDSEEEDSPQG